MKPANADNLLRSGLALDLYRKLTNEEDARTCTDIPDSACEVTPGNFLLLLLSYFFTKLGDAIANPKTVLAWLVTAVGAPGFVLAMLVPIRESGSLIPQLLIGAWMRSLPRRKWSWVAGAALQAAAVMGLGAVAATLEGAAAGWAILGLLVVFSLARGLCSVASKDVIGKTVPKGRRGQLTGWSASIAGIVTLGFGAYLLFGKGQNLDLGFISFALIAAGSLWLLAAATFALVREYRGATEGGSFGFGEALGNLTLIFHDPDFGRFVATRSLLMCSALSAPYYVALAQRELGSPGYLLGLFVIAGGLASLVSAPFWGRFADRSSRQVMFFAALVTAGAGLAIFAIATFAASWLQSAWLIPVAYFVLSIAHSGVRVGRKTYVVDLASGSKRTDYVAVSNTIIGVMLLLVGSLGVLTPLIGVAGMIGLLALMGLAGAALSQSLKDTQSS
ncbi:MFS transporter [Elongatibacter sediminis]|uniref:MFS transporter n=1 Tax=Elongatibacter sediminis TaxID=3119006 RepID=A0AAW9R627_9GAMM